PEFATADIDDDDMDDGNDTIVVDEKIISFQDVSDRILTPKCMGCHSHYESYDVVKKQIGSIFGLVMANQMPYAKLPNRPPVPLDDADKKLLSDWVNQGNPYTELLPDGPVVDDTLKPTWISLRDKVFGPKCILCHNSFGPRGPTKMTNYLELLAWSQKDEKLFNFEDPEKSRFIGSMIGRIDPDNNEFFFDPMPFNVTVDDVPTDIAPVSEAELEVIKEWIKQELPFD
ncbi:MAG: hypothetical protein HRT44_01035, partial [Bdellovibrionales bacterium]|nr:hypothetical protein [Bdellovibrionales bacterium]NQZ17835.1 hypothetical protein [Bdellovibrionales bacterium]